MLLYDLKGIYWSNMLFSIVVSEKNCKISVFFFGLFVSLKQVLKFIPWPDFKYLFYYNLGG